MPVAGVEPAQEVLEASNRNLMELQRTTTVANSKTLADYLLKAGRFLKSPFGDDEEGKEPEASEIDERG